jgi:Tol biopolymer transport system component
MMGGVMRRALRLAIVGLVILAPSASAAAPAGPRLAYTRFTLSLDIPKGADFDPLQTDVLTSGPLGGHRRLLLGDTKRGRVRSPSDLSWSPDGLKLALAGSGPGGRDIYVVNPDGSGVRNVTHLGNANSPVFSPDGRTIFFSRFGRRSSASDSIWAMDLDGSGLHQITRWRRNTTDEPTSVSPITGAVAFTRTHCVLYPREACPVSAQLVDPTTRTETLLAEESLAPAFSPDGSRIAMSSYRAHDWPKGSIAAADLYVFDSASGTMTRLTRTRDVSELASSWDPSGQRLAFTSEEGSKLYEINPDGSCRMSVIRPGPGESLTAYQEIWAVAWQPGPGREAGRIPC